MTLNKYFFVLSLIFTLSTPAFAQEKSRPQDIVDLNQVDPSIVVDMIYFGSKNFIGRPIAGYKANICLLTKSTAEGLKLAQARLKAHCKKTNRHLSLLIRDCYRPQKAVQDFVQWAKLPDQTQMKTEFYPDLTKEKLIADNYISPVSGHSRASSVDLTIAEIGAKGEAMPLDMGSPLDFFGEKSHTDYPGITEQQRQSRQLLKEMLGDSFKNYAKEWWHYVLKVEAYPKTFFDFDIESNVATHFTEPELLAELDHNNASELSLVSLLKRVHEENGLSIPSVPAEARSTGAILEGFAPTYARFAEVISGDIARLISELDIDWEKDITKTYDVSVAKTTRGKENRKNGNVTRIFNEKWLTSSMGQFILAGVMNRLDRRGFTPGTCGEVRFVYRLGYETQMNNETYASRLPLTVNMVFTYPDDGKNCQSIAQLWQGLSGKDNRTLAQNLLAGPLNFKKLKFKQLEANAQVARFPSDLENVEKRGFAGQAVYLMRIFGLKDKVLIPKKLENTPDVLALNANPEKKKQLLAFISKNHAAIETGVFLIPDEFLSEVAITYSTLGSARMANRPFDVIFNSANVEKALLEKLNTSTCMGCHQASSTAGFHLLGNDRTDFGTKAAATRQALDGNRLSLPFSPHLFAELPRRMAYVRQLVEGKTPNEFRPHPSAPAAEWSGQSVKYSAAGVNMPCPLKETTWSCDASQGLTCASLVNNPTLSSSMGQCIPSSAKIYAGLSCRKDQLQDHTFEAMKSAKPLLAYNLRSFIDQVSQEEQIYGLTDGKLDAKQYNCRPTKIGVPLGRVTKVCNAQESSMTTFNLTNIPNEICAIVGGKGFEEMAKGYFSSRRFAEGVGRGLLNTCSPTQLCREDYICQEMPEFLSGSKFGVPSKVLQGLRERNVGFCTPTYFVYQLRLDGHPNPN